MPIRDPATSKGSEEKEIVSVLTKKCTSNPTNAISEMDASDVPTAFLKSKSKNMVSAGTRSIPPPIPNKELAIPVTRPKKANLINELIENSLKQRFFYP
tara:strand:- start:150 stop:446 length:297 start_codon:yes stop_codon:yes gene_type:complete